MRKMQKEAMEAYEKARVWSEARKIAGEMGVQGKMTEFTVAWARDLKESREFERAAQLFLEGKEMELALECYLEAKAIAKARSLWMKGDVDRPQFASRRDEFTRHLAGLYIERDQIAQAAEILRHGELLREAARLLIDHGFLEQARDVAIEIRANTPSSERM